jgi:hypothetical protein
MYLTPQGFSRGFSSRNSKWNSSPRRIAGSCAPAHAPSDRSQGFYPSGQKWGGSTSAAQPGAIVPARTHYLGAFRPNQAMARDMIPGGGTRPSQLGCPCSPQMGSSIVGDRRRRALRGLGAMGQYTYASALAVINSAGANIVASPDGTLIEDNNTGITMNPVTGEIWAPGGISLGTGPASPGTGTTSVGAPVGTYQYTVTWASSLTNISSPSQILAAVTAVLNQQWGISVISNSIPTTVVGQALGFTITVQTSSDYAQLSDLKSILDGAVQSAGRSITSSNLVPTAGTAQPAFDLGTWLSNNASYLLLGGIAVWAAKEYL